jgi:hypothetical protein
MHFFLPNLIFFFGTHFSFGKLSNRKQILMNAYFLARFGKFGDWNFLKKTLKGLAGERKNLSDEKKRVWQKSKVASSAAK